MCVGVVVAAVRLIVNIKLELWNSSSSIGSESFSAFEKAGVFHCLDDDIFWKTSQFL